MPGKGPLEGFPAQGVALLGDLGLAEPDRRPGPVAPGSQSLEATAFHFEKAPCLIQSARKPGFGKAREFGSQASLAISGLPGAFEKKEEHPAIPGLPMPARRRPGGAGRGLDRHFVADCGKGIRPLRQREAFGALADAVALKAPPPAASGALRDIAHARSDIAFKACATFLVALEKGSDAFPLREKGVGRVVDIVEAEAPRIGVEPGREFFEKGLPTLFAPSPFTPAILHFKISHTFPPAETIARGMPNNGKIGKSSGGDWVTTFRIKNWLNTTFAERIQSP